MTKLDNDSVAIFLAESDMAENALAESVLAESVLAESKLAESKLAESKLAESEDCGLSFQWTCFAQDFSSWVHQLLRSRDASQCNVLIS